MLAPLRGFVRLGALPAEAGGAVDLCVRMRKRRFAEEIAVSNPNCDITHHQLERVFVLVARLQLLSLFESKSDFFEWDAEDFRSPAFAGANRHCERQRSC